jgi:hypothetical protein
MTGRKATVGLSLFGALVFWAFAAPTAMAAPTGTAFYTCVKDDGHGTFSDEHCTAGQANGNYKHVLLASGTTEVTITNNKTGAEVTNAGFLGEAGGSQIELEAIGFMAEKALVETPRRLENIW